MLKKHFIVKDLQNPTNFLGIEVERTLPHEVIPWQTTYVENVPVAHSLDKCKSASTPMSLVVLQDIERVPLTEEETNW